ncbi:MAG: hypothetical protein KHX31_03755 [Akkermansia sp.]|uniref:hypothetical protein n=1 Tax=Akkermansia sp. TaxID=1872421 RepID=UPI0025C3F618|nr:hypothetical protein [Akkermansia sp.]MBS5507730.1 hypothetical protein [Akkermansia sp.]
MNQNINTTQQPHPWVTAATPDNLRDPQLLQDLSDIGMTCLKGWHALSVIPHSFEPEDEWNNEAWGWSNQLLNLYESYTSHDDWMDYFTPDQRDSIDTADQFMAAACDKLLTNIPLPDKDIKGEILQELGYAHQIIRHLVKDGWGRFANSKLPVPGEPDYLDYDAATETWIAGSGTEEDDEYQD